MKLSDLDMVKEADRLLDLMRSIYEAEKLVIAPDYEDSNSFKTSDRPYGDEMRELTDKLNAEFLCGVGDIARKYEKEIIKFIESKGVVFDYEDDE